MIASKVINIYNSYKHQHYHGHRKKNNQKDSIPRDFRLSNSVEVYNCIYTDIRTNPILMPK
jgi:hypothetical protein